MQDKIVTIMVPPTAEDRQGFFTTFWQDFTIADKFGKDAVLDTYRRAFEEWKGDYRYLTELVMVLNHKIWEHYEKTRRSASFTTTSGASALCTRKKT